MKYNFDFKIQYEEVDETRNLRLYNLEEYLLNVAGQAADMLGFGTFDLLPHNLTWILAHLSVEMQYLPIHGEEIRIETWIEENAHMLSRRDYRIYLTKAHDHELGYIGKATSTWALLDLTSRSIANAFDMPMFDGVVDGEKLEFERAPRLLPIKEPTGERLHMVSYSDLDYNGHCNSCKYLQAMLNAKRLTIGNRTVRLDINYQKEAKEGDAMRTLYLETADQVQYQQVDAEGKTNCTASIRLL
ncbi:MAG: hypothetical protein J6T85_00350 [Paludibacteraceae bacterium]|nr:hypothetical protein [Paludibacteraceae bacterium]